jgi:hypothetical protein
MKVTIEFDNEQEAIQALNAGSWYNAAWSLDQELRGIVKYGGYIGNREVTECEMEVYEKCREMLREAMSENNLTFNL